MCIRDRGWVGGEWGRVLKTTDGGYSWDIIISGTNDALRSLKFFDENIGLACGSSGLLIRTSDGGNVWSLLQPLTNLTQRKVFTFSENKASIIGDAGQIFKSSDAGLTWDKQQKGTTKGIGLSLIHISEPTRPY